MQQQQQLQKQSSSASGLDPSMRLWYYLANCPQPSTLSRGSALTRVAQGCPARRTMHMRGRLSPMRRTLRNARWYWLPGLYGWLKSFQMSLGGHCGIRRSYPSFFDNVFQNSTFFAYVHKCPSGRTKPCQTTCAKVDASQFSKDASAPRGVHRIDLFFKRLQKRIGKTIGSAKGA